MERLEKITLLQELIKIKSINGNEHEVAEYLKQVFEAHNIKADLVPYSQGRSNLVAELKNGEGKVLGFTGHMDVVDQGDESRWTYPPFAAQIDGNKLYGRGATDMKSGLAAMVIAMIELKESKLPFKGTLKLLATVGEEVGELGAQQLTEKGYADDLDGLIIGEPTNYNLVYTHMGSINYTVISNGKEAHSSMPQAGYNAISCLNKFMTEIDKRMTEIAVRYENKELGRTIHNITIIEGGNQVNSIPSKAKLQGNIRSIPEFDNEQVIRLLEEVVAKLNEGEPYQLELQIDYNKIPVKSDKNSQLLQATQKQFEKPLPVFGVAGTTDAAEFTKSANDFEFLIFGPGVSQLAHQVDEYVEIDNYLDMIDKYTAIVQEYLKE